MPISEVDSIFVFEAAASARNLLKMNKRGRRKEDQKVRRQMQAAATQRGLDRKTQTEQRQTERQTDMQTGRTGTRGDIQTETTKREK